MRIGLQTWGTHGDIRPFLALSSALVARGHQVTLSVTEIRNGNYSHYGERYGFSVIHSGTIRNSDNSFKTLGREFVKSRNPALKAKVFVETFLDPCLEEMHKTAEELCRECDVAIGHLFAYSLRAAALASGTPWIALCTTPLFPSNTVPPPGWPSVFPEAGWKLFDLLLGRLWKPGMNRFHRSWGSAEVKSIMQEVFRSAELNLAAVSPVLFPVTGQSDYHLCGYMRMPEDPGEKISSSVEDFLQHGSPPVFITFGSMMHGEWKNSDLQGILRQSLKETGSRGIIQNGEEREENGLLFTGEIPHGKVFPRCSAVVHHGGCGTSHAACSAGVPSITVPYTSDQPMWGRLLKDAGVAPDMIPRRKLTAGRLAGALNALKKDMGYTERAREIGRMVSMENGCASAADLIERKFGG